MLNKPSSSAARRKDSGSRAVSTTLAQSARARRAVSSPMPALPRYDHGLPEQLRIARDAAVRGCRAHDSSCRRCGKDHAVATDSGCCWWRSRARGGPESAPELDQSGSPRRHRVVGQLVLGERRPDSQTGCGTAEARLDRHARPSGGQAGSSGAVRRGRVRFPAFATAPSLNPVSVATCGICGGQRHSPRSRSTGQARPSRHARRAPLTTLTHRDKAPGVVTSLGNNVLNVRHVAPGGLGRFLRGAPLLARTHGDNRGSRVDGSYYTS